VEVVNEYVRSDNECATMDDIADRDVSEDAKEEFDEPVDLFDSFVQVFVMSNGRQRLKRKTKEHKSK
jgi:hypothetical protein